MTRTKRKSASFPPQFHKLFLHVATTQKEVVVNNLGNDRKKYTTFRARMNEYRKLFREEAEEEGDKEKLAVAEALYAVMVTDPELGPGDVWQCRICPKDEDLGLKLEELLPPTNVAWPTAGPGPKEPTAGANAIADLFGPNDGRGKG